MNRAAENLRPAWQTFELEEEWPDDDEDQAGDGVDFSIHSTGDGSSLSFTGPVGSIQLRESLRLSRSHSHSPSPPGSPRNVGTVLVREDAPGPDLSRTPAAGKKGAMKDFFSPLALERMFEPPSPTGQPPSSNYHNPAAPPIPSRLSQVHAAESFSHDGETGFTETRTDAGDEILETDLPDVGGFGGLRPSADCQFTFTAPLPDPDDVMTSSSYPPAEHTHTAAHAIPPATPATDPRLRLFQFQYDTFTRDHLSAMVDSIAVNSPSLSNTGNLTNRHSSPFGLSRVAESNVSGSDTRSAKRVKLSPMTDFQDGGGEGTHAVVKRDTLRRDYVGESQSLMAQIRQARDFSTLSTVASRSIASRENSPQPELTARQHSTQISYLDVPQNGTIFRPASAVPAKESSYSSLGFRAKGAELMAQIKDDFRGAKRVFSNETDASQASHVDQRSEASFRQSVAGSFTASHPYEAEARRIAPSDTLQPTQPADYGNTSMDTEKLYAQFPAPPIMVAPAMSPLRASSASAAAPNPVINPNPSDFLRATGQPVYPSTSLRTRTQEDLNRLVSGSTASGTTVTAGSSESFVKHAGPAHITRIAPEDVPSLPERVGAMVFDRTQMRWVKKPASHGRTGSASETGYAASVEDGESDDPFRDIESFREDDSGHGSGGDVTAPDIQIEVYSHHGTYLHSGDVDDDEADITSFSFDVPSAQDPPFTTGDQSTTNDFSSEDDDVSLLVNDMRAHLVVNEPIEVLVDADDGAGADLMEDRRLVTRPPFPQTSLPPATHPPHVSGTPQPPRNTSAAPTPIRSALKNSSATTVPFASLRNLPLQGSKTPVNRNRHRRSVSFSDGKRDGPIRGLGQDSSSDEEGPAGRDSDNNVLVAAGSSFVPSARSKRIANFMEGLENSGDDGDSPTKTGGSGRPSAEERQRLATWRLEGSAFPTVSGTGDSMQPTFTQTHAAPPARTGNATFLTEASFGLAHDKLVQVITDIQPFEPYWENLSSIDLSRKHLEGVTRLKEFLPQLHSLSMNYNQLAWLSGVPACVRTLSVAHNVLTRMTSFNHLLSLESLDVSNNEIDSLTQLECLRHLRELRADGNRIASLDGLEGMDGLTKLSLQGNRVVAADFTACAWPKLEMLNLSHNHVERINGLSGLKSLVFLNLDHNALSELIARTTMHRLRVLRISANKLSKLQATNFPHLRTLYADNNILGEIVDARKLARLENLSLRNQGGRGLTLSMRDVRDVKRLYLSGNPLPEGFLAEPCYNLVYLELAACRLTRLPSQMPALAPNLRALNLNYNFIDDIRPLGGLSRLNKLTVIGSSLKGTKAIIRVLRTCPDAEIIDFRMNPCTLGWYLPLLVHNIPGALQPSEDGPSGGEPGSTTNSPTRWQELDAKFRRDLPDSAYAARLAYRGLIMRACPRVRMLDGVPVSAKERDKAEKLLATVLVGARGAG